MKIVDTKRGRLPARPPPRGDLAAARFHFGAEEYVVLSFPVSTPDGWSGLTASEQAVAWMLLRGMSNRQIASARERSVRTVANQVASIFQKLGVRSRAELCRPRGT